MSTSKANLKKLLTPIIRECVKDALEDKDLIQEIVLSSGVLSTIVRELAIGLNESMQRPTFESHMAQTAPTSTVMEAKRRREVGRAGVSKLPIYEKKAPRPKPTTELGRVQENISKDYSGKRNKYGALAGSNPEDEGVSLASLGLGHANASTSTKQQEPPGGVDLSELNIGSMFK